MIANIFLQSIKILFLDFVGEVLYFPIWWYSRGLKRIFLYFWRNVQNLANHLALKIMIKNLFRPMFAQYDKSGRAISFVMRIILLLSRFVVFVILSFIYLLILLAWIILPLLIVWQLFKNIPVLWRL